jgi:hypothetical protein
LALADSFAVFRGPILLIGHPASPDARRFHAFRRAVSAAVVLGTEVSPAPLQEAEPRRQSPRLALRVPPHQRLDNDNLNHGEFTSGERDNPEHDGGWLATPSASSRIAARRVRRYNHLASSISARAPTSPSSPGAPTSHPAKLA